MIFRRKLRTPHLYGTQQQRTAQSRCRLSDIGSHDRLAWLRVRQTVNRMSCNYVFEYQRAYEDALSSSLNTRISASSHTPVQRLARTRRSSASAVRSAALARVRATATSSPSRNTRCGGCAVVCTPRQTTAGVQRAAAKNWHLLGNFTLELFARSARDRLPG